MYGSIRYFTPVRNLMRVISQERSPRQIAAAVALGMMIGLLPKGNLVAAGLTVLLFSLRVNLGVGLTTVFLLTLVSSRLDPVTHGLGARMINHPMIHQSLVDAYQRPIFPWTSLNNTVVLGASTLGLILCYPVYHITYSIVSSAQQSWRRRRGADELNEPSQPKLAEIELAPESVPERASKKSLIARQLEKIRESRLGKAASVAPEVSDGTNSTSDEEPSFPRLAQHAVAAYEHHRVVGQQLASQPPAPKQPASAQPMPEPFTPRRPPASNELATDDSTETNDDRTLRVEPRHPRKSFELEPLTPPEQPQAKSHKTTVGEAAANAASDVDDSPNESAASTDERRSLFDMPTLAVLPPNLRPSPPETRDFRKLNTSPEELWKSQPAEPSSDDSDSHEPPAPRAAS